MFNKHIYILNHTQNWISHLEYKKLLKQSLCNSIVSTWLNG